MSSVTCYDFDGSTQSSENESMEPCGPRNDTLPSVPCCYLGDTCYTDQFCKSTAPGANGAWYVAGCTDPGFLGCYTRCNLANGSQFPTYDPQSKSWICCDGCNSPSDSFSAPPPSDLVPITSLALTAPFGSSSSSASLSHSVTSNRGSSKSVSTSPVFSPPFSFSIQSSSALASEFSEITSIFDSVIAHSTTVVTTVTSIPMHPTSLSSSNIAMRPSNISSSIPSGGVHSNNIHSYNLSPGTKAEIAVSSIIGVLFALAVIGTAIFFRRRKCRQQAAQHTPSPTMNVHGAHELEHNPTHELEDIQLPPEMPNTTRAMSELDNTQIVGELEATEGRVSRP